ncbi:hypothetical protein SSX86_014927 [Deinandra increscens subsp. villosa]|uniref:J domain-containing protein n=1 Tax=Deinandra increscens subsp. villosa TaxID=3103831 RepID=A0AAP0D0J5_9ASTR
MDCNKEEAVRAKELAEKKMEIKDFSGALKIAVKAQQLYPELENVSQLILVCEVHCSAEKKSYGTDKDWYGILKVEPTADDTCIKKQYRKLALLLHPDKNNFSGSTDAFKLIGEAQRVLLDREKRMVHDSKRKAFGNISASGWIPKQPPSRPSNPQQHHPWNHVHPVNLTGNRPTNSQFTHQRAPTGIGGHLSVFWTVCPFCKIRYHFYRDMLNKVVSCQGCMRSFFAYESNAQGAPAAPTTNINQTRHPYNNVSPNSAQKRGFTAKPVFEKKEPPKAQGNANRKRKKRMEESSESSDSSESSESEEDVNSMPESESGSESDDDTEETEPAVFDCPDPEFSDFDKHKKEECFRTGQIWACYDTEDAMPRFYALIKENIPRV